MINGETVPNRTVTLNDKYTTKSDGDFAFSVKNNKPFACMSDIRWQQYLFCRHSRLPRSRLRWQRAAREENRSQAGALICGQI